MRNKVIEFGTQEPGVCMRGEGSEEEEEFIHPSPPNKTTHDLSSSAFLCLRTAHTCIFEVFDNNMWCGITKQHTS
jgi:hypothetical protein